MIAAADTPIVPRGVRVHHDRVRDAWVLLAPERAISLDPVGLAIMRAIDNDRTLGDIAGALSETYGAPVDQVTQDCAEFIQSLADRRILEIRR